MVERHDIEGLDWEITSAEDFVAQTRGLFAPGASGALHHIEPLAWTSTADAAPAEGD
jgi:hypothetical protein